MSISLLRIPVVNSHAPQTGLVYTAEVSPDKVETGMRLGPKATSKGAEDQACIGPAQLTT